MQLTRFAANDLQFDALAFTSFDDLPIRPALGPPNHGAAWTSLQPQLCSRIATTKGIENGGFIPLIPITEKDWQMAHSQTALDVTDQLVGLIFCAFADDEGDHQLTVCRHRRMIPKVAGFVAFIRRTVFFFLTKLHCSSNSKARGVRSWTC